MHRPSQTYFNLPRHRSHSYRERPTFNDLIPKRDFEVQQNDTCSSPSEYIENVRTKLKHGYDQIMQQKMEKVEELMNQRYEEERRLSERKLRKIQIAHEKFRLQTIDEIIRERDAICEEKLAAQRNLYTRLLDEQAQRFQLQKNVQSYEHLNVDQLKERLTRVENSNHELQQLILQLMHQKPTYRNTLVIPHASK